jgi:hypothetical protein
MQRNGSATSSTPDTSPAATLTSEASLTCGPTISAATSNAISSPASADGPTPSVSPGGPTTDLFGQVRVPVRLSQARLEAATSRQTDGPIGSPSSLQVALEQSLASRLPIRGLGSIASAMTWVHWITKSGRRFFRLSVSEKTMRARGFTLWATPTATANQACASMAKWPGCNGIEVTHEAWCRRMGYPPEWLSLAPSATPSFLKSRQSLSDA